MALTVFLSFKRCLWIKKMLLNLLQYSHTNPSMKIKNWQSAITRLIVQWALYLFGDQQCNCRKNCDVYPDITCPLPKCYWTIFYSKPKLKLLHNGMSWCQTLDQSRLHELIINVWLFQLAVPACCPDEFWRSTHTPVSAYDGWRWWGSIWSSLPHVSFIHAGIFWGYAGGFRGICCPCTARVSPRWPPSLPATHC